MLETEEMTDLEAFENARQNMPECELELRYPQPFDGVESIIIESLVDRWANDNSITHYLWGAVMFCEDLRSVKELEFLMHVAAAKAEL